MTLVLSLALKAPMQEACWNVRKACQNTVERRKLRVQYRKCAKKTYLFEVNVSYGCFNSSAWAVSIQGLAYFYFEQILTSSLNEFCPTLGSEPTRCRDYQEVKIQEQVQKLAVGTIPRSMWVVLEDDLVDCCKAGDNVTICGIVMRRWRPILPEV